MKERNIVGRVIIASLIGGATYLGAGALEANSNQSLNQDKPNNPKTTEVVPQIQIPNGENQCKIQTQGEQDFVMSEEDCKELNVCESHTWPTTDGTKGTPFWDKATTIYDSKTGICHIKPELFYGAACGGCEDPKASAK